MGGLGGAWCPVQVEVEVRRVVEEQGFAFARIEREVVCKLGKSMVSEEWLQAASEGGLSALQHVQVREEASLQDARWCFWTD